MESCDGGARAAVRGLKKGPWTAVEDAILIDYVRKKGEGNWNAVQKNSGLMRCGKSCRLRWANHLRPNLKKGSFTPEEEKIIIELHAKMGNKWARMAAQLPGRTDNEIKNYWNTRMKRRQRAGLPLYPQEVQQELTTLTSSHFQYSQEHHHKRHLPFDSPSSSSSFSSSSSYHPGKRVCVNPFPNPSLNTIPLDSSINFQIFSLYNHLNGLSTIPYNETATNNNNNNNNGCFGFALPLSSSLSSNGFYNPNHLLEVVSENSETNNNNISGRNMDLMSYSALLLGEEIEPAVFTLGLDNVLELPLNQTSTNSINNENEVLPVTAGNSGLLDALLEESQALYRGGESKEIRVSLGDTEKKEDECLVGENLLNDLSTPDRQSSIGTDTNKINRKEPTSTKEEAVMNSSSMVNNDDDDDMLISLLNNFPSSTPLPDWYRGTQNQFNGSYFTSSCNREDLDPSPASTTVVDPTLDSCCWSNMPRIC